jgi:guanyl-specific ribonuclease Sa
VKLRSSAAAMLGTAAVLIGAAALPAQAAPTHTITGGNTKIALSTTALQAVRGHGFTFSPISRATLGSGVLRLPTNGGTVTGSDYVIKQGGGFSYSRNGKKFSVTNIVLNTKTHRATGDLTNFGNIVVFVLGDANRGNGSATMREFAGYSVTLSYALSHDLDHAYNTQVFVNHPAFGTGDSTVYFTN